MLKVRRHARDSVFVSEEVYFAIAVAVSDKLRIRIRRRHKLRNAYGAGRRAWYGKNIPAIFKANLYKANYLLLGINAFQAAFFYVHRVKSMALDHHP